jgi:hypothetical protein
MARPTLTLKEVVRDLKPLPELVALCQGAMKDGALSHLSENDLGSVAESGNWVTNFIMFEADKSALSMFPANERRKRSSVSILYLKATVQDWMTEFVRSFPDCEFSTEEELSSYRSEHTVFMVALIDGHYTYGYVLPNGTLYGRDGLFTIRFLQVLRARVELAARTLCGENTTLSKVPFCSSSHLWFVLGEFDVPTVIVCQMLPRLDAKMPRQTLIARDWGVKIMKPPSSKRRSVRVAGVLRLVWGQTLPKTVYDMIADFEVSSPPPFTSRRIPLSPPHTQTETSTCMFQFCLCRVSVWRLFCSRVPLKLTPLNVVQKAPQTGLRTWQALRKSKVTYFEKMTVVGV